MHADTILFDVEQLDAVMAEFDLPCALDLCEQRMLGAQILVAFSIVMAYQDEKCCFSKLDENWPGLQDEEQMEFCFAFGSHFLKMLMAELFVFGDAAGEFERRIEIFLRDYVYTECAS